jgi:hypothetical protein
MNIRVLNFNALCTLFLSELLWTNSKIIICQPVNKNHLRSY